MKITHIIASTAIAFALTAGSVATAQSTTETKVSSDTSMENGVATKTTKVEHIHKRKTHHAKRILGVKVGHKTAVSKTVKETKTSADGDKSTSTKTTHN